MEKRKLRKDRLAILIVAAIMIVLMIRSVAMPFENEKNGNENKASANKEMTLDEKAEDILSKMSPEEKIGQMMMVGIHGTKLDEYSAQMLNDYHFGGIILFNRNMETKNQVKELNQSIQKNNKSKLPLFIAVDEEGGFVARMKNDLNPPPSQQKIGEAGDPNQAKEWAKKISVELKEIGFNINFAPVADIGSTYERSYSTNAEEVFKFVQKAVEGYSEENLMCSLKHFPGIGKGETDSHLDQVIVNADAETLRYEDIYPFQKVIEGNEENYFIMITHVNYPAFDSENPASLSKIIMQDLLREELGFKGIIITDDMEMGAISRYYDFADVGVKSITAGADIVLICHEYEHEQAIFDGLMKAYREGILTDERLNESVRRIIKMKIKYLQGN